MAQRVGFTPDAPPARPHPLHLSLIVLAGFALRLLRLDWQPLWWDEGYSLYFATEPLAEMLRLTALDIHPPLYYALLHGWFALLDDTGAVTARWLSVILGTVSIPLIAWTARALVPGRPRVWTLAAILLALSPMHLYYSQEVRMYTLALPLTMLSTIAFAHLLRRIALSAPTARAWPTYALAVAASLATLYYSGLLFIAHQVWALMAFRRRPALLRLPMVAGVAGLLLQGPWLFYALPKLLPYITGKVQSDQDSPLPLLDYLWRHLLAFTTGHLPMAVASMDWLRAGVTAIALAVALTAWVRRSPGLPANRASGASLLLLLTLPLLLGFLINLRYPFFPPGGERLLLTLLPYFLILVALGLDTFRRPLVATAVLLLWLTPSFLGIVTWATTARSVEHDYRPIVRFIAERGRTQDRVIALFPWQVGYWRAYSPRESDSAYLSPQPDRVDQEILRWSPAIQARLDAALEQGTLWFPAPLSLGSTLPSAIEEYLVEVARPLENRWFSPATRVSAWVVLPEPTSDWIELDADYGRIALIAARSESTPVLAANTPLGIDLLWRGEVPAPELRASLRLVDSTGHVWAQRDLTPVAAYTKADGRRSLEQIAFSIPVGVAPGDYSLVIAIGPADDEFFHTPTRYADDADPWIDLGSVRVMLPASPPDPARLPIAAHPAINLAADGWSLLGAGPLLPALAGTDLDLSLFWRASNSLPSLPTVSLRLTGTRDRDVALTYVPLISDVPAEADRSLTFLLRQPGTAYLPPDMQPGDYRLVAQLANTAGTVELGSLSVSRRPASFAPVTSIMELATPIQFGTHAELTGYAVTRQGTDIELSLTWHILQTLLPPHAIFVHAIDEDGLRVAQQDGPPVSPSGPAPTGSWLPGEWITTQHRFSLPESAEQTGSLQVGLYLPTTLVRLPASSDNAPIGDAASIPLP